MQPHMPKLVWCGGGWLNADDIEPENVGLRKKRRTFEVRRIEQTRMSCAERLNNTAEQLAQAQNPRSS